MLFESTVSSVQTIVIVYIFPGGSGSSTKQKILKGDKEKFGKNTDEPRDFYKIRRPMLEATSSVVSLALIFRLSRMGLTSAISRDVIQPHSAIVSIIR